MAFADAGGGDFHKLGFLLHLRDGGAAAVAHAGTDAAGHLVDDGHHRALVRHAPFNAFGHELVGVGVAGARLLEVAVGAALLHGTDGAHATVALVAAALEQNHFARRLFGTGKHAAHHDRAGTCRERLGNVAAVADAAISNQRHTGSAQRGRHAIYRHDLRHAHTGHDTGGADRARANAHFDRVGTGFHQRQRRRAGGNVAANHIHLRIVLLDPAHTLDHAMAVAVRRVHHDGVHAGAHQCFDALFGALAHTHGRAHAQFAQGVARGTGEAGLLGDVLHRNQALEFKRIVDHQQALDFVLVKQHLGLLDGGAVGHGNEPLLGRHDQAYRQVVAGFKAQVTPRDDAHHLAAVAHRKARHAKLFAQSHHLAHCVLGGDDHRVAQHARLVALDLGHLGRLLLGTEVLVNYSNPALLGNGNRQARLGDRVHGGRHKWQIQCNIAGKAGGERCVLGQDLGVRWHQQHIVEGERFAKKAHVKTPKAQIVPAAPPSRPTSDATINPSRRWG